MARPPAIWPQLVLVQGNTWHRYVGARRVASVDVYLPALADGPQLRLVLEHFRKHGAPQ